MKRTKRIETILLKHLKNFDISVIDNSNFHKGHNGFNGIGETHILIELKRNLVSNINRLDLHKKINLLLKDEFDKGLHSLQIKII